MLMNRKSGPVISVIRTPVLFTYRDVDNSFLIEF